MANITFEQVRESAARAGLLTARLVNARTALIPSSSIPGHEYAVWIEDGGAWVVCECPDGGAHCWHGQRALELYRAAQTRPSLYSEAPEDAPRWLYCEAQDAYLFPDDMVA